MQSKFLNILPPKYRELVLEIEKRIQKHALKYPLKNYEQEVPVILSNDSYYSKYCELYPAVY